jgi:hypothetical protein
MGFLGTLFEVASPMPWELGEVPGRKQSLRLEDIYDMTPSAESKYPESVWAPPPGKQEVVSSEVGISKLTFNSRDRQRSRLKPIPRPV